MLLIYLYRSILLEIHGLHKFSRRLIRFSKYIYIFKIMFFITGKRTFRAFTNNTWENDFCGFSKTTTYFLIRFYLVFLIFKNVLKFAAILIIIFVSFSFALFGLYSYYDTSRRSSSEIKNHTLNQDNDYKNNAETAYST